MAKRNWTKTAFALLFLPACAQMHPVSTEGMPAGESAGLAPPVLLQESQATLAEPAPAALAKPNIRMKRMATLSDEMTVIASTDWQDHGAVSDVMPMPKMDPVTEAEMLQVAPMEAEVGIVSFLRRHLLVLLSGLCLGGVGLYAFYIYPSRRQSGSNRFG